MAHEEIKIRALPRKNEKAAQAADLRRPAKPAKAPRWIIYVGTMAIAALLAAFALPGSKTTQPVRQTELASVQDPVNMKVTRHLQDSYMKEEMLRQKLQLDNLKIKNPSLSEDSAFAVPDDRSYGVQLDQENTAETLYRDLNYRQPVSVDYLPEDRINSRLATRKWINEHERTERINFVRQFILSMHERGFEVDIDANLVVVGVRRVERKVPIEQILDRLSKQGF